MLLLNLVKITDTSGMTTGQKGGVTYQALTEDELDDLSVMQGGYSHIGRDFDYEELGEVQVPSVGN
jgi:hypothetical protein